MTPRTSAHIAADGRVLADETTGYLAADHVMRRISPAYRAEVAAVIYSRYRYDERSGFDRGYRRRLAEFTPTTPAKSR